MATLAAIPLKAQSVQIVQFILLEHVSHSGTYTLAVIKSIRFGFLRLLCYYVGIDSRQDASSFASTKNLLATVVCDRLVPLHHIGVGFDSVRRHSVAGCPPYCRGAAYVHRAADMGRSGALLRIGPMAIVLIINNCME